MSLAFQERTKGRATTLLLYSLQLLEYSPGHRQRVCGMALRRFPDCLCWCLESLGQVPGRLAGKAETQMYSSSSANISISSLSNSCPLDCPCSKRLGLLHLLLFKLSFFTFWIQQFTVSLQWTVALALLRWTLCQVLMPQWLCHSLSATL